MRKSEICVQPKSKKKKTKTGYNLSITIYYGKNTISFHLAHHRCSLLIGLHLRQLPVYTERLPEEIFSDFSKLFNIEEEIFQKVFLTFCAYKIH